MDTKLCKICGLFKPMAEFTKAVLEVSWRKSTNYNHPHQSNKNHHSYCKVCNAEKARQYRAAYSATHGKGYRGTNKLKKVPVEDRKIMSLIRARLAAARTRIKKYDQIATDLDEDFLYEIFNTQNRKCALTGVDFIIDKSHLLCPSLDKIDPSLGYTKGNVQWLAWAVNRAKGELSTKEFTSMCKRVIEVAERATTIP